MYNLLSEQAKCIAIIYHLTSKCDLDLLSIKSNVSNYTFTLKEDNFAKLFSNPCIDVKVMARRSSVDARLII